MNKKHIVSAVSVLGIVVLGMGALYKVMKEKLEVKEI